MTPTGMQNVAPDAGPAERGTARRRGKTTEKLCCYEEKDVTYSYDTYVDVRVCNTLVTVLL